MSRIAPPADLLQRARALRLLALDVDGVLTDGSIYLGNAGEELKGFSILDGQGLVLLRRSGVEVAIITGRESRIVERRAAELGIDIVRQKVSNKLAALGEILAERGLGFEAAGYMGDDLPDLACLRRVGLGVTVPNAHPALLERCAFVTPQRGGQGAVRQVCDWILQAQGNYQALLETYL